MLEERNAKIRVFLYNSIGNYSHKLSISKYMSGNEFIFKGAQYLYVKFLINREISLT